MTRADAGRVTRQPYATRETCANGHPWTVSTTRWRVRRDKGESTPTRDCLVCKRVSEGVRRRKKISERNYQ